MLLRSAISFYRLQFCSQLEAILPIMRWDSTSSGNGGAEGEGGMAEQGRAQEEEEEGSAEAVLDRLAGEDATKPSSNGEFLTKLPWILLIANIFRSGVISASTHLHQRLREGEVKGHRREATTDS